MNNNADAATVISIIILGLLIVIFWPIFVIWAWNVLFGAALTIPTNFYTWLAVIVLTSTIKAGSKISSSKK